MGNRFCFYDTARDGNAKVLCDATISVYLAGTTTVASVYTASSGGTAVNSVTSGSETGSTPGYFIFWIDRDDYVYTQRFKYTISKDKFTSTTYDYINIFGASEVLAISGTAEQGDVIYYNGTNYIGLPHGTSGQLLITQGHGANPTWSSTVTAHKTSHQDTGSDEISVTGLSGLLGDGQTPLAHKTSHQSGGSDAIKLDDLSAPDDNTDLNSSATVHGLLKKLSNTATQYMDGTGNWSVPGGGLTYVRKTANETVTNSTVLQNDDHLLLAVAASEVWEWEIVILLSGNNAASDLKCGFSVPTGATLYWNPINDFGASVVLTSGSTYTSGLPGTLRYISLFKGIYIGGANAGNLQFKWAQSTGGAGVSTTIEINSFLRAYKLA